MKRGVPSLARRVSVSSKLITKADPVAAGLPASGGAEGDQGFSLRTLKGAATVSLNNQAMNDSIADLQVHDILTRAAARAGLEVHRGGIRRTSSRLCLGVEHGDYNGTELFGVATGRFLWLAYKPNHTDRVRLFSTNFPNDGIIDFKLGSVPAPQSAVIANTWARFPWGVDHILRRDGFALTHGFDAVLHGNIPGGGMSRSASLCLNLLLTFLDVNDITKPDDMKIIDMAQAVENDYIGSPCGNLDQIMIYFSSAGTGTHYDPKSRSIHHIPLGKAAVIGGTGACSEPAEPVPACDFRFVTLDTGTVRPGLEKSTYKIRRAECEELVALAGKEFGFSRLANIRDQALYDRVVARYGRSHVSLCARLNYVFHAQQRFHQMLDAWKAGDIETVGAIFRRDGIGLRDDYQISGPELETMCEIARSVPGVLGERMLGGGDKGAAGAIVRADSVEALKAAVDTQYPRRYPHLADKYAVHVCQMVDGVTVLKGL
jgi:galactokinase